MAGTIFSSSIRTIDILCKRSRKSYCYVDHHWAPLKGVMDLYCTRGQKIEARHSSNVFSGDVWLAAVNVSQLMNPRGGSSRVSS